METECTRFPVAGKAGEELLSLFREKGLDDRYVLSASELAKKYDVPSMQQHDAIFWIDLLDGIKLLAYSVEQADKKIYFLYRSISKKIHIAETIIYSDKAETSIVESELSLLRSVPGSKLIRVPYKPSAASNDSIRCIYNLDERHYYKPRFEHAIFSYLEDAVTKIKSHRDSVIEIKKLPSYSTTAPCPIQVSVSRDGEDYSTIHISARDVNDAKLECDGNNRTYNLSYPIYYFKEQPVFKIIDEAFSFLIKFDDITFDQDLMETYSSSRFFQKNTSSNSEVDDDCRIVFSNDH